MADLTGKILVVVDMEPGYRPAMNPAQLKAVKELIRLAVQAESFVVFLQFYDQGTLRELLSCVRRYDMFAQVEKQEADGSEEVIAACRRGDYDMDGFVICGVETGRCVAKTAQGLSAKLAAAKVEVIKEACGSARAYSWDCFPRRPNLHLVSMTTGN